GAAAGKLLLGVGGAPSASGDGRRRLSASRLLSLAMGPWEGSTGGRGGGGQGRCPSLRRIQREEGGEPTAAHRRPSGGGTLPSAGSNGKGAGCGSVAPSPSI
ncbi:Os04g0217500, partial [Oryza sativa Japonica Group]